MRNQDLQMRAMFKQHLIWKLIGIAMVSFLLQVLVAATCVLVHGKTSLRWNPVHNPRQSESPVVFFLTDRIGLTHVEGLERPGSLLAKHEDEVSRYNGIVWWPRDAVTMRNDTFGVAAGWPFRSMTGWCSTKYQLVDEKLGATHVAHNGVLIADTSVLEPDYPVILPLKPNWFGTVANTVIYSVSLVASVVGVKWIVLRHRRKKGVCLSCAYPLNMLEVCPECGTRR